MSPCGRSRRPSRNRSASAQMGRSTTGWPLSSSAWSISTWTTRPAGVNCCQLKPVCCRPSRAPMTMSRSVDCITMLARRWPQVSGRPKWSGSSDPTRSMAFQVVRSGTPKSRRRSRLAAAASRLTPPPRSRAGRSACSNIPATTFHSPSEASGGDQSNPLGSSSSSSVRSTGAAWASRQISMKTGPFRGVRPRWIAARTSLRPAGSVMSIVSTQTGRTIEMPSTSWMPRWRIPPSARSVDLTWPPTTSRSRLSRKAPAMAVVMLVRPGPAVTSTKARSSTATSLKYSAAIPAATSCTNATQAIWLRTPSRRCMLLPPATKKQWVYPSRRSHSTSRFAYFMVLIAVGRLSVHRRQVR